jgi:hypothetical protein
MTSPAGADIPPASPAPLPAAEGTVRASAAPDAPTVSWTHHFDRNSLSAACIAGDSVLAVTRSDWLLRFDLKTLKPTGETFLGGPVAVFADAPGFGPLVAFADGRLFAVDPATLTLRENKEKLRLPGRPLWLGGRVAPGRKEPSLVTVCVVRGRRTYRQGDRRVVRDGGLLLVEETEGPADAPPAHLVALPAMESSGHPSAFLLDSQARLWMGADFGEWGGYAVCLNLNTGRQTDYPEFHDNVFGFCERPDGAIWAYGGLIHLGSAGGFVTPLKGGRADRGYRFPDPVFRPGQSGALDSRQTPPASPDLPITHILPEPGGNGAVVFTYGDVFTADADLRNWKHRGELVLSYRSGRPDAVGSYPAINSLMKAPGGRLLAATVGDGLVEIAGGKAASHAEPARMPAAVVDAMPVAGGLVLAGDAWDGDGFWERDGKGWKPFHREPPVRPPPGQSWESRQAMPDGRGGLLTVEASDGRDTVVTLTRWGKPGEPGRTVALMKRSVLGGWSAAFFITPDGRIWSAAGDKLYRLDGDDWREMGPAAPTGGLRVVGRIGDGWLLLPRRGGRPAHLEPSADGRSATLTALDWPGLGEVRDAVDLGGGRLLLATDAGLKTLDSAGRPQRPAEASLPHIPDDVRRLCRDGSGRLWLAGRRLWLLGSDGRPHALDALPTLTEGGVVSLVADPADPSGIAACLGPRGVLFVTTAARK